MSTPKEVIRSLAVDFKRRNLNYADIAGLTGYSRQTIANIMSSQEKYFCGNQALRFSNALGYDKDYLMTGKGSLYAEEASPEYPDGIPSAGGDSQNLATALAMMKRLLKEQERILEMVSAANRS